MCIRDRALNEAAEAGCQLIDKTPRAGAEGLQIGFLHPKSTNRVLTELCGKKYAFGNINLEIETDHIHRYLGHNLTRLLELFVDVLPHMEVGAVMLLAVAFQSDQIGQLPQSIKQRGGVLSVFDSVRVGNGNHLVVHIQDVYKRQVLKAAGEEPLGRDMML